MACAAACTVVPHKFKGDSSELVDKLVAVSNYRPAMKEMKERDLTPFDFADAPPLPLAPKANRPSPPKRSPRTSPPKQQKAASGQRVKVTASPISSASPARGSLDGRAPMAKPISNQAKFQSLDEELAKVLRNVPCMPSAAPRACPGFFASPSPDVVPMPTSLLMGRALVKA
ncbi:hypothetical protein HYH02_008544 [Chlamydomonas schloesseri]|uniref:Uncharacterized protein n=1 Tax=Chlamydomonas schloesseri TaxID=2026947 RepID=A0A836B3J1_9CHLO|nr:hypothetical protein HYH02_008544 [Chlamydomonas schloesseri]|eukprot:KAG2446557.1 hypothetical protein HYH02_008544 [Chlamydomonas schloesseri]